MVDGNPLNSLPRDIVEELRQHEDSQFLVYANSAQACEEAIINRIEGKLGSVPKEHIDGKLILAITGKLGIMGKNYLAEAFAGEREVDDNGITLPTLYCMACTEAV